MNIISILCGNVQLRPLLVADIHKFYIKGHEKLFIPYRWLIISRLSSHGIFLTALVQFYAVNFKNYRPEINYMRIILLTFKILNH